MDPQQRKLLDLCLRNYAASPEGALRAAAGASTGVYLGVMWTEYQHLAAAVDAPRTGYLATGNGLSFLVGRPSFVFGLVGPSAVVDTACSSSLVAARMATRAVAVGEASDAHAAGTQCMLLADTFDVLDSLRALSPDGRCKTLDAAADGYGRGDGFAAAYLRPERAEDVRDDAASDSVRVLGSSVNQDGRSSTFTAPFGPSQHALVRDALLEARADPATVRFLSAHGTGTSLGDPIEFAAAGRALDACDVVLLGASKSFLGHTEGAAGLSALFLAVAAAANAHAPSLRHCRNLNPHVAAGLASSATSGGVAFAATRSALAPFARPGVQGVIAGASSFGMSGVNAHCIVRVTSPPHDRGGRVLVADAGRFWCASGARVTALLDSARIVSAATATFRCHLGAPRLAYADHHRIDGVAIFPGTAAREAARVALGEDADGRGTLVDVAFVKPLVLARDGDPLDLVVVVAKADGKVRVGEERTRREGNGNPYPPPHANERADANGVRVVVSASARRVAAHADESGSKPKVCLGEVGEDPGSEKTSGSVSVGVGLHPRRGFSFASAGASPPTAFAVVADASAASRRPAASTDGFAAHPAMTDASLHLAAALETRTETTKNLDSGPRVPASAGAYHTPSEMRACVSGRAVARRVEIDPRGASSTSHHALVVAGAVAGVRSLETKTVRGKSSRRGAAPNPRAASTKNATKTVSRSTTGALYDVAWHAQTTTIDVNPSRTGVRVAASAGWASAGLSPVPGKCRRP